MTDDDLISRIEVALEAGPTPGPWMAVYPRASWHVKTRDGTYVLDGAYSNVGIRKKVDADYIAACNPSAVRSLLNRLKAAEAVLENTDD